LKADGDDYAAFFVADGAPVGIRAAAFDRDCSCHTPCEMRRRPLQFVPVKIRIDHVIAGHEVDRGR